MDLTAIEHTRQLTPEPSPLRQGFTQRIAPRGSA
jgi:hypothetical protein